jgi:hypothetical protein
MPKVPENFVKEQYQLRASFFYERLDFLGFPNLNKRVSKIASDHKSAISWASYKKLGISVKAWESVEKTEIEPALFFIHPNIIKIDPTLLRYYRSIALLPQKGFQRLTSCDAEPIESGKKTFNPTKVEKVVQTLNQMMSFLLELEGEFTESKLNGAMYATAGVTIDGSWRNAIGAEGERVIRSLLLKSLLAHKEVQSITFNDDTTIIVSESDESIDQLVKKTSSIRNFVVTNSNLVIFKSEPDIEIVNPDGVIIGGIEIKAGLDPAGALERLGAMFKSFNNIISVSPKAETILVASCITEEVEKRIREARSVKSLYILTEIINDSKTGARFVNNIRGILGFVDRAM